MTTDNSKCPICKRSAKGQWEGDLSQILKCDCDTCGSFRISDNAVDILGEPKMAKDLYKISAYLRERYIAKQPIVKVVTSRQNIVKIEGHVIGVDDILAAFPKTVSERLDRALRNLHRKSIYPGEMIELVADKDYPVFFAENEEAFFFVRDALHAAGWIDGERTMGSVALRLTARGWNRIAELEREIAGKDSRKAFVAMWFDRSLDKAYTDGFEKAITAAGYEPLRVDLKEHNEKIDDAIIAEIRKSRFVVADFTGHRGGVYCEAGFAKGLGLEVIWTCHEDEIDKSHFDTRQYNHIVWKDEKDLCEKLRRRIEATIF